MKAEIFIMLYFSFHACLSFRDYFFLLHLKRLSPPLRQKFSEAVALHTYTFTSYIVYHCANAI